MPAEPPQALECVGCYDPIGRQPHIRTRCGHSYDPQCVIIMVESATRDERYFPPRCCGQEIPKRAFVPLLPHDTRLKYEAAVNEFAIDHRTKDKEWEYGGPRQIRRHSAQHQIMSAKHCQVGCSSSDQRNHTHYDI